MTDEQAIDIEPVRSSRDRADVRGRLATWLQGTVNDPEASIDSVTTPSGSGMSSETLLFDAAWEGMEHQLVARLAPAEQDTPVFQSYDLDLQFRVMELVAAESSVKVPKVLWLETDPEAIGSPFFVMERASGRVPADIPPYVFEGWLLEATGDEQRRLQEGSVGVLAALHQIDPQQHDTGFLELKSVGDTSLRRMFSNQRHYYDWVRGERTHPIVEEAFGWLEANWPDESPAAISWGDARIGNIMYSSDGFDPVAVLDWEMATVAPPEVDLGWMVFLHSFFQNIAEVFELRGLPDFMRPDDVREMYIAQGGSAISNLHWFEVFAGLRHAIIMSRITERMVRFGDRDGWPDDVDEVIPHRDLLRSMIGA